MEVRKSAAELRGIWVAATFKTDPEKAAMQIRLALNLIRVYAVLSAPFIPDAAAKMLSGMNTLDTSWPDDVEAALKALPEGHAARLHRHAFTVPEVLFAKITDEQTAEWTERFAGTRD